MTDDAADLEHVALEMIERLGNGAAYFVRDQAEIADVNRPGFVGGSNS